MHASVSVGAQAVYVRESECLSMYTCMVQRGQAAFARLLNSFFFPFSTNCCSFARLHSREGSPPLHTLHLRPPHSPPSILPHTRFFHPNYGASHMHGRGCLIAVFILYPPPTLTHLNYHALIVTWFIYYTSTSRTFIQELLHVLFTTLHMSLFSVLCVIVRLMPVDSCSGSFYLLWVT